MALIVGRRRREGQEVILMTQRRRSLLRLEPKQATRDS